MVREFATKCECKYVAVFTHVLLAVMLAAAVQRTGSHGSCVVVFFSVNIATLVVRANFTLGA